ncbi:heterokaryon incompatibility protein-domain-containing protein [Thelonectria olida]|uniref:Heterokaryon incompatibility protein-domain-containing protein n=1 Tax=Thelonectria olida TaxID=1576542 RepID=A0A9P8VMI8_9HYPO|nr:heterokaryon incompatibility protein-domain-containing protein [Thelonectria olida]
MTGHYQYEYLGAGSIRVLHLVSVKPEIIFNVEHVSLDSEPVYNALSYTWGDPVFSRRVHIGHSYLNVTPSLHDCLQHLGEFVGTKIWIDALCINQLDDEEKSRQVQGMARVYRQASKVLIWLGTSTDGSDQAMKGIATYGKAAVDAGILNLRPENFAAWPDMGDDAELVKTRDALLKLMKKATDCEGDVDRIEERLPRVAFATLTNRSYFTRVWVKQEITLARDTTVLCGEYMTTVEYFHALVIFYSLLISWEVVEYRAGRITRIPGPFSEQELMAAESPWDLQKTAVCGDAVGFALSGRRSYRTKGPEPLYRLLQQSYIRPSMHVLCCKDPRDKIWGLSGLASDMSELGLEVNYKNSVEEAYEATARALLRQGYTNVLKWCRSEQLRSPSWVPNWALPIWNPWSEDTGTPLFKASGVKCQTTSEKTDIITPGTVRLQGVLVDVITESGSVWKADSDQSFDQNASLTIMRELMGFLEKSRYPEEKKMDALWRIPIGDKELPESSPYFVRATERSKQQFLALASKVMDSDLKATTYSYQSCMGYNYMTRPVASGQGYVGLGPSNVEPGDVVVLLFGGSTPFVLRQRADSRGGYYVIGEAYIYGIMDGEFMENCDSMAVFELF